MLKPACLLLASLICTIFCGFQSIMVLAWFQPLFLLRYFHSVKLLEHNWCGSLGYLFLGISIQTIGSTVGFADMSSFTVSSGVRVFLLSFALWVLLSVAFLSSLAYKSRYPKAWLSQPFVFASIWTTLWYFVDRLGPNGAVTNPANTQHSVQALVLTSNIWGIYGIVFLMGWFAALADQEMGLKENENLSEIMSPDYYIEAPKEQDMKLTQFGSHGFKQHRLQRKAFLIVCFLCLLYGGVTLVLFSGSFFQRGILETLKPTIPVSCIIGEDNGNSEYQLNKTAERVAAGDWIVLWSEGAMYVEGDSAENQLLSKVSAIAHEGHLKHQRQAIGNDMEGPYIGITYYKLDDNSGSVHNFFSLVLPNGSLGFKYRKSHPVPFFEPGVVAGPAILPTITTGFGRLGAAICFDFEYPDFMKQSGIQGVDIMLQPAQTWGATGHLLFYGDSFRAVENGFTLFRCASEGISGVVTPSNNVIDYRETGTSGVVLMQLPLAKRQWTLYPYVGFYLNLFVMIAAAMYMMLAFLPHSLTNFALTNFPQRLVYFLTGNY